MTMYQRFTITAAGLFLGTTALLAQVTGVTVGGQNFQQADTMVRAAPAAPVFRVGGAPPIAGSPFSATEERHSTQTLSDGTVLETTESTVLYRDNEGRTRSERTLQGKTTITIVDPIAHTNVRLDPSTKIAFKSGGTLATAVLSPATSDKAAYEAGVVAGMAGGRGGRGAGVAGTPATTADAKAALDDLQKKMAEMAASQRTNTNSVNEELGMMNQNGVPAQGTRTTLTIPVGQIGNSREIKVVNERWYSQELQMTVKSVNSDPRYGTSTYELRNINRSNPPLSFFQIPPDYTVQEGGGGGRGGSGGFTTTPVKKN
jgi:hypothetical protein